MSFRILSAGLFLSAALVSSNAYAADLGGDCCADLEERIAELEATTARKGNRKVSLTIYGQVTTAVMFWDADRVNGVDEQKSNVYVVDPQTSGTRFGFKGGAKITSDWSAGYQIELQWQPADATLVRVDNDEGPDLPEFRLAYWELKSKTYGGFQVGQTNTANSGIAEIDLSITSIADGMSSSQAGAAIIGTIPGGPGLQNFEFNRRNVVTLLRRQCLQVSLLRRAYGEDDIWDVAIRYAGEFAGFKIAAGVAYGEASDGTASLPGYTLTNGNQGPVGGVALAGAPQAEFPIQVLNGGASIVHTPTGLFATGSAGQQEADGNVTCNNGANCDTEWFWFAKGGIQQKWSTLGKTALFGMGGEHHDANDRCASTGVWVRFSRSTLLQWISTSPTVTTTSTPGQRHAGFRLRYGRGWWSRQVLIETERGGFRLLLAGSRLPRSALPFHLSIFQSCPNRFSGIIGCAKLLGRGVPRPINSPA